MSTRDNLPFDKASATDKTAHTSAHKDGNKSANRFQAAHDPGHLSKDVHDLKSKQKSHGSVGEKIQAGGVKHGTDKKPAVHYLLQLQHGKMDDRSPTSILNSKQDKMNSEKPAKEQATPVVPFNRDQWRQNVQKEGSKLEIPDLDNGTPDKSYFEKFKFDKVSKDQLPTIVFIVDYSISMFRPDEGKQWKDLKESERPRSIDYAEKTLESICAMLPNNINIGIRVLGAEPLYGDKHSACHCQHSELVEPIRQLKVPGADSVYQHFAKLKDQLAKLAAHETPIPYALETTIKKDLHGIAGKKLVILITDGASTCGDPRETAKKLANDPDAQNVDMNIYGINLKKQPENELKATANSLNANFNNLGKEELEGAIIKRVSKFLDAQVLPRKDATYTVKNGSRKENWEEKLP